LLLFIFLFFFVREGMAQGSDSTWEIFQVLGSEGCRLTPAM